jgi:hypothetical protein
MTADNVKELLKTHKPTADLHKDLLEEFNEDAEIYSYVQHTQKCDKQVSYRIRGSFLVCTGNCYKNVTNRNLTFPANARLPANWDIAFGCNPTNLAYTYAEMTDVNLGTRVSFTYQDTDFGRDMKNHQQLCASLIINPVATDAQKQECRFNMPKGCRNKIENSCVKSGLADFINMNRITKPLPAACDNFAANYNKVNCVNWINARIIRNTLQIRINQLDLVSDYIASEDVVTPVKSRMFLRYLDDTYDDVPADITIATQEQNKVILATGNFTDIDTDINVEGSTENFVANTDIKTIDQAAKENEDPTPLPSSGSRIFVSVVFFLAMIFMI